MITMQASHALAFALALAIAAGPGSGRAAVQEGAETGPPCSFSLTGANEGELPPGGRCAASFKLGINQALILRVQQVTGDVEVRVLGTDATLLAVFDQTRSPEDEVFRFATAVAGDFTLVIAPSYGEPSRYRTVPSGTASADSRAIKVAEADANLAGVETALKNGQAARAVERARAAATAYADPAIFGQRSRDVAAARVAEANAHWFDADLNAVIGATAGALEILPRDTAGFDKIRVDALNLQGAALFTVGRVAEAIPLVEEVVAMFERHFGSDHPFLSTYVSNLGEANRTLYRFAEANRYFERAYRIAEKHRAVNPGAFGTALNQRALLAFDLNDYAAAAENYEKAINVFDALPEEAEAARVRANLGVLYTVTGQYRLAERYLLEALLIRRRIAATGARGIKSDVARNEGQLGQLLYGMGDLEKAESYLRSALEAYTNLQASPVEQAIATNALATVYEEQGKVAEAEALYVTSLDLVHASNPESPDLAYAYANLARFLVRNERTKEAHFAFERSLAIRERHPGRDHALTAEAHLDLAEYLDRSGRPQDAEPHFALAERVYERAFGRGDQELVRLYSAVSRHRALLGDVDASLRYAKRAGEAAEAGLAISMFGGSEEERLRLAEKVAAHADYALSLHLAGRAKGEGAASFVAETVLRTKGRIFDVVLDAARRLRARGTPEDAKLLERIGLARMKLTNAAQMPKGPEGQLVPAVVEAEAELLTLAREMASRADVRTPELRIVSLAGVRGKLPQGAVLVEFALYTPQDLRGVAGPPSYAAVILTRDRAPVIAHLGAAAPIDDAVMAFREELKTQRDRARVLARSTALFNLTIGKFAGALGNATQLIIAPDGTLATVPFSALADERGKYLIKRFDISYVTSGRDLLSWSSEQGRRTTAGDVVVVAAPPSGPPPPGSVALQGLYPPPPEESVPMADEQKSLLEGLFPGATVYPAERAAEAAVKASKAPVILHICAHGFFREAPERGATRRQKVRRVAEIENASVTNPMLRSGVYLAEVWRPGLGKEDGVLTALEAMSLDLRGTELVTLSACDSGLGDVVAGEGVFGLRRALSLAGARAQLVSLWRVQGGASLEFMERFYGLLDKGVDARTAFSRTQREMLDGEVYRYRHPGAWAAFVLVGQPISLGSGSRKLASGSRPVPPAGPGGVKP